MKEMTDGQETIRIGEETARVDAKWVATGEAAWHKEIITEVRSITIPLRREEMVVERKYFDYDGAEKANRVEISRIPLREERLEIKVQPFDIQEVAISKQKCGCFQKVDIPLTREVLAVKHSNGSNFELVDLESTVIGKKD